MSWTNFRSLIYIDDPLKREFYLEMCRSERWSTRTLQGRLDSMRGQGVLSLNLVLKDPYVLDSLELRDRNHQRQLGVLYPSCIRKRRVNRNRPCYL